MACIVVWMAKGMFRASNCCVSARIKLLIEQLVLTKCEIMNGFFVLYIVILPYNEICDIESMSFWSQT